MLQSNSSGLKWRGVNFHLCPFRVLFTSLINVAVYQKGQISGMPVKDKIVFIEQCDEQSFAAGFVKNLLDVFLSSSLPIWGSK